MGPAEMRDYRDANCAFQGIVTHNMIALLRRELAPQWTEKGRRSKKTGEKEIGDVNSHFALRFYDWSNSLAFRDCPGVDYERDMDTENDKRLLNRQEAAAFLAERGYRVAVASLNKWASVGGGPRFRKFGRRPLYAPSDLIAWAQARTSALVGSVTEAEALQATGSTTRTSGK
jgi:hypothetical protein